MEAARENLGLGGDGDEISAIQDVEDEFGVRLDYSCANTWSTVGDVYTALLAQLSPEEAAQADVWDRFSKAIGRETGISPSTIRADRHSEDDVPKMVVFRDPERSVLKVCEHRKRGKPPFAGRQG
ncbi:MAG: hypothetical protein JNL35_15115 [Sphingopyxis sp.]|nr:hypothetical protein [Sphingopyxis sp.]